MRLMVGCMLGSSLAMAPAMVVGQFCEVVDLDGPLLQSEDWPDGIMYRNGTMSVPVRTLLGMNQHRLLLSLALAATLPLAWFFPRRLPARRRPRH